MTTTRYIAFLRGINVGGHRLGMDDLRMHFEKLKFTDVVTFIATGNVIFNAPKPDAAKLEQRIEAHLRKSLGYNVDTFLRTPAEVAAIVDFMPFVDAEMTTPGHTIHVGFLREAPSVASAKKLVAMRTPMDEFCVEGREMYWLCRGRTTDSRVSWPVVAKSLAITTTMRNINTVRKLALKHPK